MKTVSKVYRICKEFSQNHKIYASIIAIVVVGGGYYYYSHSSATTITVSYGRVHRGSVSESVSGTGQVSATSQVDLKPKVNANVTEVLVNPGDTVKKGQVLFRLDARDAYKQVRDAKLALNQAQNALDKLKQPPQTIDVITLQDAIKKAQAAKVTQDTNVATAYSNLLSNGLQAIPEISYTTETAPTISGTYTKTTEGQIHISMGQGTEGSSLTLYGAVNGTAQYSSSVAQPLGDSGLYIKFNASQSNMNWVIDIPNKRSSSYLSLYNAYINAQQNRDLSNADSDRQIAENTQKLNDLQKGAKDIDLAAQELVVEQRQNSLLDAGNTLSDYTITAPFDGSMASVSAQVGLSAVTAASNGATSLGTIVTSKEIAVITLNETDIAKVHMGQPANITFDALDGVTATGTVADIDGVGTITQGVVSYKVKIYFDASDVRIKPSMSVSVDIITNSKDQVLVLSSSAIKHDTSGYYVETDNSTPTIPNGTSTWNGTSTGNASGTMRRFNRASSTTSVSSSSFRGGSGTSTRGTNSVVLPSTTVFTKIPITIGVQGTTMTEITSGLSEGQQVVTKKMTTTKTTATPSVTSLLRGSAGGAGGTRPPTATGATRGQ